MLADLPILCLRRTLHPAGTLPNSAFFEDIRNFCLDFTMMVYEKIYFEAHINSQYI